MLSSSSLTKIKRYQSAMTGEKLGWKLEETLLVASRSWTWHFHSASMSGWVVSFTGHITMVTSHHPHLGLMLPIHHVSVVICSREVIQRIHLGLTRHDTLILHSFMTTILNLISSDSFHLHENHLLHSMSLMWDSLRPSYDGSLLVDINSLSKKLI